MSSPAHDSDSAAPTGPKIWSVGTLRYTSTGLVILFCWLLLGDFSWSMRERSVGPMAQWYLTSLNVSSLVFALLLTSFPAFMGLLLGPIISVMSDRHRGRYGRRIPFLLVTTPFAALGMIGLAMTPIIAPRVHALIPQQDEVLVAVVCFGVFWAAFELATIIGQSVFGGLINDVVPAEFLGRFYGLFRAVSLIDGMIFNHWLWGKLGTSYSLILTCIGIFYGSAFMWVCFKVKEGEYPAPPPPPPEGLIKGPLERVLRDIKTYWRECFQNRYYLQVFLMLMVTGLAFTPVNTFCVPFAKMLGVKDQTYGDLLTVTYATSFILAYPLGWLADRFHPLRVSMIVMAGYACVTVWGAIFARDAASFQVAWLMHGVLSGCYFTTGASIGQRLFPRTKFAQFASAAGIFGAIANMGLAPLLGKVIDSTGVDAAHREYRYTFALGALLAVVGLVMASLVYIRFRQLGGEKGYVAPETGGPVEGVAAVAPRH